MGLPGNVGTRRLGPFHRPNWLRSITSTPAYFYIAEPQGSRNGQPAIVGDHIVMNSVMRNLESCTRVPQVCTMSDEFLI